MREILSARVDVSLARALALALCLSALIQPAVGDDATGAPAGVSRAMDLYARALRCAKGDGVPQDYSQAAEYMRQAAEAGYALAQNDLGVYYAKGLGVKQDYAEAAKWYRKAADQGDPLAEYSLGRICLEGRGVPTNVVESLAWYKKAADQNQPDALLALGYLYFEGHEGIRADWREALHWFQKAVAAGRAGALNSIGFMYEHGGTGVDQDLSQALNSYRDAANRNDAEGQMNLGRLYYEGLGVKTDYAEAYKWFYLAHSNGSGIANHYLQELEGSALMHPALLTPDQISKATQAAQEIQRKKLRDTPSQTLVKERMRD